MILGILTSVETRHRYFAQVIRAHLPVAAVAYEETGYTPADTDSFDLTVIDRWTQAEPPPLPAGLPLALL